MKPAIHPANTLYLVFAPHIITRYRVRGLIPLVFCH
jgi:hypothetical protein